MSDKSYKRVLVTGATGFIGQHSLKYLVELGFDVHAITRDIGNILSNKENVIFHEVDLFDNKSVESLVTEIRPSHLLHFAWYAEPGKYWTAPENFECVSSSLNLLRIFSENGGKRVVMAGTCAEYDWDFGWCSESTTPCMPTTVYGVCKNAMREMLFAYSNQYNLSSAWGRVFFLYGPNEHPSRLVSSVICSILKGLPAQCSSGEQVRDFMHVSDVASAFVSLLDSNLEGVVNIASGESTRIKNIVKIISDKLGRPELLELGAIPSVDNDPPLLLADVRRLNEELGWHPVFDIETGIDDAINWWKQ